MSAPAAFRFVVVPCPSCQQRNVVDCGKAREQGWPRCRECSGELPRRRPRALVGLVIGGALAAACLAVIGVGAWRDVSTVRRRSTVRTLIAEGRSAEAIAKLPEAPRGGVDLDIAREVAVSLAAIPLAVDADDDADLEQVTAAVAEADRLMLEHAERLPELLDVIDAPAQRLMRRREALQALSAAEDRDVKQPADLRAMESDVRRAVAAVASVSTDVEDAVLARGADLLDRAALDVARELVRARRPKEARAVLQSRLEPRALRARRTEAPAERGRAAITHDVPEDAVSFVREALERRDPGDLQAAVEMRPDPSWPSALAASLDEHVEAACLALASTQAKRARAAAGVARGELLLSAMTCDEVLPKSFLQQARRAAARALHEAARSDGDVQAAVDAWIPLDGGERERALADLGCVAERRAEPAAAVRAWAAVDGPALDVLADCSSAQPPAASSDLPSLDYPGMPRRPPGEGA